MTQQKLSDDYDLFIVKKNDGKDIRLANFWHILRMLKTGNQERCEVLMEDVPKEDTQNELFQKGQTIWWSIKNPRIIEATRDDKQAEIEHQKVLEVLDTLPDIDPTKGDVGTLVKMFNDKSYKIVDGSSRKIN